MKKPIATLILCAFFSVFSLSSMAQSAPPEIQVKIKATGTASQVVRITRLSTALHQVINSPEFKERVEKSFFKKGKSFSYSDDSGAEVFQKILDGAELNGPIDNTWDLSYKFESKARACFGFGRFKKCSAWVLGWTTPKITEVYINSIPWDNREDSGIIGTMVHEQLHKLGYGHPSESTSTRPQSVPYAVGNIAAEISKKFL